jgi:hypothetical protein
MHISIAHKPQPRVAVLTHGSLTKTRAVHNICDDPSSGWLCCSGGTGATIRRDIDGPALGQWQRIYWHMEIGHEMTHRSMCLENKVLFILMSSYQCGTIKMDDIGDISACTLLVTKTIGNCIEIYNIDDFSMSDNILMSKIIFALPALSIRLKTANIIRFVIRICGPNHIQYPTLFQLSSSLCPTLPGRSYLRASLPHQWTNRKFTHLFVYIQVFLGMDPGVSTFLAQHRTMPPCKFKHVD